MTNAAVRIGNRDDRPPQPARRGERDAGDRDRAGKPLRRCLVSGVVAIKDGMIRFVLAPSGEVIPDIDERLPGRGFWLSSERDLLKKACAKNLFAKSARSPVKVPADLVEQAERLLSRRCLNLIGLARRVGQVTWGFERVCAWLDAGRARVVLEAVDGAAGGRAKLKARARDVPVLAVLTSDELGTVLARDRVVHVALGTGRLGELIWREARRLAGIRGLGEGAADNGRVGQ